MYDYPSVWAPYDDTGAFSSESSVVCRQFDMPNALFTRKCDVMPREAASTLSLSATPAHLMFVSEVPLHQSPTALLLSVRSQPAQRLHDHSILLLD